MNDLKLTNEPLRVEDVMKIVSAPNCGAISLFVGTTRDNFNGKQVLQLEYEAYDSMAYKMIQKICLDMREKWKSIENIAIHHRLGIVPVAESSVVIAISSPHRTDALEATQWCIDTLKKTVPIWKKEIYANENPEWKENKECSWAKKIKEFKKNKVPITRLVPVHPSNIPSHLIQITCSNSDLNKRIQTFIDRKREHVNNMNIRDFCGTLNEESCARASSVLIKQKNAKTHLKVARVYNTYGPRSNLIENEGSSSNIVLNASHPVEERLQCLEHTLNISKPVPKDVYDRLKQIEDRLLQLESISPEYAQFWNKNTLFTPEQDKSKTTKRKYSLDAIDKLLFDLESKKSVL